MRRERVVSVSLVSTRLGGWASKVIENKAADKRSLASKTVCWLKSLHLLVFGRKRKVKVCVGQPSSHQREQIGSATPNPRGGVLLPGF